VSNENGRWEFDQEGNVHFVPEEPDGAYHYSYQSNNRSTQRSRKGSESGWHWVMIILGFAIAWPIGLVLLFLELSHKWPNQEQLNRVAKKAGRTVKDTYQTANQRPAPQPEPQKSKKKQEDGAPYGLGHIRLFRRLGIAATGVFGFAFTMTLVDEIRYFYDWGWLIRETLPLLALTLMGVTLIGISASRRKKLSLFQKYKNMVGNKTTAAIGPLASAMGKSEKQVEKDLEEMLERGFWDSGYVDAGRKALVLGAPIEDIPDPEPQPQPETQDTATLTLRRIRQINDAIANPELSEKIYRIEELTGKIFRLLEERPEKTGELRSFMNYYLPQTLKILESYAKLEAQGIDGENIAEAKGKIEAMMDKLVDGYETQLDKLFADDVLDISADLKVMESMLEKDGLTAEGDLRF
jgi:hypothetical protein